MGGIIIAITLIIMMIVLSSSYKQLIPLSIVIVGFGVVGFIDDFKKLVLRDTKGLKPAYKILRIACNFSSVCTISNKNRDWNRNFNSRV